ncbi:hypothetical protein EDB80DRAFT_396860 [Ilyonectria destructans]|nr:hypothetical protein EDB80DRAFT_396860 [Ilyonectria destructans]
MPTKEIRRRRRRRRRRPAMRLAAVRCGAVHCTAVFVQEPDLFPLLVLKLLKLLKLLVPSATTSRCHGLAGVWLAAGWLTWAAGSPRWARVCVRVCVCACMQASAAPRSKGFYRRPITAPVQGNTEFAVWVPGSAAVAHHTSGDEGRRLSS